VDFAAVLSAIDSDLERHQLRYAVPATEHLAAMKVLAMKNDPRREPQELADIPFLLTRPDVDRERVREYFQRHGLLKQLHDVERNL